MRILLYLLLFFALAAAALFVRAGWVETASLGLVTYTLPGSPPALRGLRIAVISDLHAGAPHIDEAKIDQVVALTNRAKPDLILLTGDYIITGVLGGHPMSIETIAAHLKALHAPLGVYAVLGNHDRRHHPEHIVHVLEEAGIPDLENAHIRLPAPRQSVTLVGFQYRAKPQVQLQALAQVKAPAICFTHSPDIFPELPGTCALTIAGHTHGGQIQLPLLGRPAMFVASRFGERYAKGIVREGGKTLFVSSGIGTSWLPLRFGVPPEVSILTLP